MKMLDPTLIRRLDKAAARYGDDPFFAIRSEDEWFVCNWVFGLRFTADQVMNCPHFTRLIESLMAVRIEATLSTRERGESFSHSPLRCSRCSPE